MPFGGIFVEGLKQQSLLLLPISCLARGNHSNWRSKSKVWGLQRIWKTLFCHMQTHLKPWIKQRKQSKYNWHSVLSIRRATQPINACMQFNGRNNSRYQLGPFLSVCFILFKLFLNHLGEFIIENVFFLCIYLMHCSNAIWTSASTMIIFFVSCSEALGFFICSGQLS